MAVAAALRRNEALFQFRLVMIVSYPLSEMVIASDIGSNSVVIQEASLLVRLLPIELILKVLYVLDFRTLLRCKEVRLCYDGIPASDIVNILGLLSLSRHHCRDCNFTIQNRIRCQWYGGRPLQWTQYSRSAGQTQETSSGVD